MSESEDVRRRFDALVAGSGLHDLARGLGGPEPGTRPELRRTPLDRPVRLRVRASLEHSRPEIWRTVDLRSDLTLDVVHQVLQSVFGWYDGHLHRFSLGGEPFDRQSQLFLCPFDIEEGDDDGVAASGVRLDEVLQDAGDVLHYIYDYGDSWELLLRLEEVLPVDEDRAASCVDGARAAPPEDCGGFTEADDLATVLDDPASFDLSETDEELRRAAVLLGDTNIDPRLVDVVRRLRHAPVGAELRARLLQLLTPLDVEPDAAARERALAPHLWFLDRVGEDGLALTSAGYLRPDDVRALADVLPAAIDWIGERNREAHTVPVLDFRESLQRLGLVRKRTGRLLLTKLGATLRTDPDALWAHLVTRARPRPNDDFEEVATLLVLLCLGAGPGRTPLRTAAEALTALGWAHHGGPVAEHDLLWLPVMVLLGNVGTRPGRAHHRREVSVEGAALARAALRARRI